MKMYDSVSPGEMPKDGDVYAAYVDHNGVNGYAELSKYYPGKIFKSITNWGAAGADIIDVEHGGNSGSASFSTMAKWVASEYAAGRNPTVYCDGSTWPQCKSALNGAREPQWWIASYGNGPTIPTGAIGVQYLGDQHTNGLNFDVSNVLDGWAKPSTPKPPEEEMELTDVFTNTYLDPDHATTVKDALAAGQAAYSQVVILNSKVQSIGEDMVAMQADLAAIKAAVTK